MSSTAKMVLEVLAGPLDGAEIPLESAADWSKGGSGPLVCTWDEELGDPQAHFTVDDSGWHVGAVDAPHGTYRMNKNERLAESRQIAQGDIFRASQTWLLVRRIE